MKNKLRQFRFMNDEMTQQHLAKEVGVSRQTIIAIEKGKFNPSIRLALLIAKFFNTRIEEIFYLEDKNEN
ncbi:MAG: helix-turn-helix transcriptional regulator [Armatimonadetes bacterium]|nr:helix-turn-helix transcriptional regulator [Armatimonadota bacterium]